MLLSLKNRIINFTKKSEKIFNKKKKIVLKIRGGKKL